MSEEQDVMDLADEAFAGDRRERDLVSTFTRLSALWRQGALMVPPEDRADIEARQRIGQAAASATSAIVREAAPRIAHAKTPKDVNEERRNAMAALRNMAAQIREDAARLTGSPHRWTEFQARLQEERRRLRVEMVPVFNIAITAPEMRTAFRVGALYALAWAMEATRPLPSNSDLDLSPSGELLVRHVASWDVPVMVPVQEPEP
jgi:hypothetical protein